MFRQLILLVLIIPTFSYAKVVERDYGLKSTIGQIAPAVAAAGVIDYMNGCASCAKLGESKDIATLISKDNNQKIELSVLTEEEAENAFAELAGREDIPYGFLVDGCYARAHKMTRLLEEEGIIAGKAFIEGQIFADTKFGEVAWGYQVAPVVMVKTGNKTRPFVIDPSLFNKPVPYEEWKSVMTKKSKTIIEREYYTNRFAYDPGDRDSKYKDYQDEKLADMDYTNRNFSLLLFMYESKKSKRN